MTGDAETLQSQAARMEQAAQLWAELVQRFGNEGQAGVILAAMYLDAEKEAGFASRGFGRMKPDG